MFPGILKDVLLRRESRLSQGYWEMTTETTKPVMLFLLLVVTAAEMTVILLKLPCTKQWA